MHPVLSLNTVRSFQTSARSFSIYGAAFAGYGYTTWESQSRVAKKAERDHK